MSREISQTDQSLTFFVRIVSMVSVGFGLLNGKEAV